MLQVKSFHIKVPILFSGSWIDFTVVVATFETPFQLGIHNQRPRAMPHQIL